MMSNIGWLELSPLNNLNVSCIPRWGNMSRKRSYQRKPLLKSCWTEVERGSWAPSTNGSLTCWPTWNLFRTKSHIGWTPLRRSWMVGLLPTSLPIGRHCELARMSCFLNFPTWLSRDNVFLPPLFFQFHPPAFCSQDGSVLLLVFIGYL